MPTAAPRTAAAQRIRPLLVRAAAVDSCSSCPRRLLSCSCLLYDSCGLGAAVERLRGLGFDLFVVVVVRARVSTSRTGFGHSEKKNTWVIKATWDIKTTWMECPVSTSLFLPLLLDDDDGSAGRGRHIREDSAKPVVGLADSLIMMLIQFPSGGPG